MVEWNQAVDQIMKVIDLLDNYGLWNGYETHCSIFLFTFFNRDKTKTVSCI